MKKSLLPVATAALLFGGMGLALAQSDGPSEPDWNANQGQMFREYSTTRHYSSYSDTTMHPAVGMVLPNSVTVYEMPGSMTGPSYSRYRYGMINDHPVVIENSSRKVVHTWD
jgi:hypothetical protein